jgi:hypothetical protein
LETPANKIAPAGRLIDSIHSSRHASLEDFRRGAGF